MPTLLVTGAKRGLGLEFVRQYAADGWRVIATVRDPDDAADLHAIDGEVAVAALDVADFAAIDAFAATIDDPLDLVICNAGIMGPYRGVDAEGFRATLTVNTIAPTMLARALVDRVAAGGKLIAITSQMGSIGDNSSGGAIAYRSSKAALNMAWRSLAIEWKDKPVTLAMLHPGWVQTDMGGANAPTRPADSIAGMRGVIDGLTPDRSGRFLDFRGKELPW